MTEQDKIYIGEIKPRSFTISDDNGDPINITTTLSSLSLFIVSNNTIIDKFNWQSDNEVLPGYKEFENVGSDGIVDILVEPTITWEQGNYTVICKYKTNTGLKDEMEALVNTFYISATPVSAIETE